MLLSIGPRTFYCIMNSDNRPGQLISTRLFFSVALTCYLLVLVLPSLMACADTSIRVANMIPKDYSLEVWLDGGLISNNLEYKEITSYISLPPGDHRIIAKRKGVENPKVINAKYPLREDKEYTAVLVNDDSGSGLGCSFVIDTCPPSNQLAQVRFTDVVNHSPPLDLSVKYGPILYSNFSFLTTGSCVSLPAGTYTLQLKGTSSGERLLGKEIEFERGYRYHLLATGDLSSGPPGLISLKRINKEEEEPKVFGIERSILQLFGAGIIASLLILVLGQ